MKQKENMLSVAFRIEKIAFLMLALVLLIFVGTKSTAALLTAATDPVTNAFDVGAVACKVNNDYTITNIEGNISNQGTIADAYIRAAVVTNWEKEGGAEVYGTPPKVKFDLGTSWEKDGDYYYYKSKVGYTHSTTPLINNLTCDDSVPDGYTLTVRIVAEAIQADGTNGTKKAAEEAWGLSAGILQ